MSPKTIQQLQYYVGKVCSIVTTSMNRAFDEQISREHFVIIVQTINSDGRWGVHPYNQELVSFFTLQHIISIHQEIELNDKNSEHSAMIKEYEERTGKKIQGDLKIQSNTSESTKKRELLPILDEKQVTEPEELNPDDVTFVNIKNLEQLATTSKNIFDLEDKNKKLFSL